jgi:hypothetical protein
VGRSDKSKDIFLLEFVVFKRVFYNSNTTRAVFLNNGTYGMCNEVGKALKGRWSADFGPVRSGQTQVGEPKIGGHAQ